MNNYLKIKDAVFKYTAALLIVCLAFFCLTQCVPPHQYDGVNIDWKDPIQQQIYTLQDKQMTDSLYLYMHHENPTYRYLAAMAFASIKDNSAIDSLAKLLSDPFEDVRIAAAYSLGQIADPKCETILVKAFQQNDSLFQANRINSTILEAIGRCGSPEMLHQMALTSTYTPKDTFLLEGQARGIYRFGLRNIIDTEATNTMLKMLNNNSNPNSARLMAAHYFSRIKGIVLDSSALNVLNNILMNDNNAFIRMAVANGLAKSPSDFALNALLNRYPTEQDYRTKCNIIRGLGNFDYSKIQPVLVAALRDPNLTVANLAANTMLEKGASYDAPFYWQSAKDSTLQRSTQNILYAAANRHFAYGANALAKDAMNAEITNRFIGTPDPYEKASLLRALGEFAWNYKYIKDQSFSSVSPVVKTTGIEVLGSIAKSPTFYRQFGYKWRNVRWELGLFFLDAVKSGDVGMMAAAAEVLKDSSLGYKDFLRDSVGVLAEAQKTLKIPKDIETYNLLQETINAFSGTNVAAKKTTYNHPIVWATVNGVNDNTRAIVQTSKGEIVLRFFYKEAPGSVSNFVQLAGAKFFDNKAFHRVVPNFVAQVGCPRGDGYGALDYSIRSELSPLHYNDEGYVGMASAGNHTEGTQWFITHSPTPHLDGNYTIFAKVEKGMEVVHQLQVGDMVQKVSIK